MRLNSNYLPTYLFGWSVSLFASLVTTLVCQFHLSTEIFNHLCLFVVVLFVCGFLCVCLLLLLWVFFFFWGGHPFRLSTVFLVQFLYFYRLFYISFTRNIRISCARGCPLALEGKEKQAVKKRLSDQIVNFAQKKSPRKTIE